MQPVFRIDRLLSTHDRSTFNSGVPALDRYLQQQAGQDLRWHLAAVFVVCPADTSEVLGYYTLSATSVEAAALPETLTRRLPRYPVLPAVLLGRLAVDRAMQGRHLGQLLLQDALRRSFRSEVAAMLVVVDAIDEAAARFYEHYGFQRFPHQTSRLYLSMGTIARLLGTQP